MRNGIALIWIAAMTAMVLLIIAVPDRTLDGPITAATQFSGFR